MALQFQPHQVVLVAFIAAYACVALFKKHRPVFVWGGIVAIAIFQILYWRMHDSPGVWPHWWSFLTDINWNVMGIFVGTLVVADSFIASRAPAYLADLFVNKAVTARGAIVAICILTSVISAFVENVATVLIVAPIVIEIAARIRVSPAPILIAVAISSNLQGTATLVGDPPSMILAGYERMTFNDFFFLQGRPGIFFAVQCGAVASFLVLLWIFRKHRRHIEPLETAVKVTSWFPSWLLVGMVVGLAISSFIDPDFVYLGGVICMVAGIMAAAWMILPVGGGEQGRTLFRQFDWDTTFFLAGVFVLVGAFVRVGLVGQFVDWLSTTVGNREATAFISIVVFSVLLSAFVDNVPYITAMIPVAHLLGEQVGSPMLLAFGLLVGACLGGNITPVGAAANIVAVGLSRRAGYPVSFWEFARIGLPFTIAATAAGATFLWLVWGGS